MNRKLIAILRGITSNEVEAVSEVLIEAGIDWLEVPLNSPQVFESIELMAKRFSNHAHIGAGTVIKIEDVAWVKDVGGSFIVSPNCDQAIIEKTKDLEMGSYPGVYSPTECFAALKWGADALKLFPASLIGTSGVTAIRAVLPKEIQMFAVGGVDPSNIEQWKKAGINGFGIGSAIYQSGKSIDAVKKTACEFVTAYDNVMNSKS
ncbi:UNVERIFIED_CONTAM: hypothetical protein GTU68_065411 [Idotea baltica]|nr:hypothetical protein [Idotea baltica]